MASPILNDLVAQVTASKTVMASATLLINGFSTRLQTAIDAALAEGATKDELAPLQELADGVKADVAALAAAITANT